VECIDGATTACSAGSTHHTQRSRATDAGGSTDSNCCCCCETPQIQLSWLKAAPAAHSSGSDGSSDGGGGGARAEAVAGSVHFLDALCRDVLVTCQRCGACCAVCFLSGLRAFRNRLTYSSAGEPFLLHAPMVNDRLAHHSAGRPKHKFRHGCRLTCHRQRR
jgi:hypothetical protein